eukprot:g5160.t1
MSNEEIVCKLKSEKDTKVCKAVEDATSIAVRMDITIRQVERLVSEMRKCPKKSKLLDSLKHLNYNWKKIRAFARNSADANKWDSGMSLAAKNLSVGRVVNPRKNMKNINDILDRSMRNMDIMMENEIAENENKENLKPRKKNFKARTRKVRKVRKGVSSKKLWKLVKSKERKGVKLKIPREWGEPEVGDEYSPREVLGYLESNTPSGKMKEFIEPLYESKLIPVSYDAVMYVRFIYTARSPS